MTIILTKPWEIERKREVRCPKCGEDYISGSRHKCKKKPPDPFCKFREFTLDEKTLKNFELMNKCIFDIYELLRFKIKQE